MKLSNIDIKSCIIGALTGVLIIVLVGGVPAQQQGNDKDTIVAKQIKITNEKGEDVIVLGSLQERGVLYVKDAKTAIVLAITENDGRVTLTREGRVVAHISTAREGEFSLVNTDGKRVAVMGVEEGRGTTSVFNKAGEFSVSLASSSQGEGIIMVSNKDGEGVGALECDQGVGRISLMDKNLKLGWMQKGGQ
jgi:hypothetical protein